MAPLPSHQLGLFGTHQVASAVARRAATPCPPAPKHEPPRDPVVYWPPIVIAGAAAFAVMFVGIVTAALVSLVPAGNTGGTTAVAGVNPHPVAMVSDAENDSTSTQAATVDSSAAAALSPIQVDPSAAIKPPEPEPSRADPALAPDLIGGGACAGAACAAPAGGGRYGTAIAFVDNPADAGAQALKDKKLLFMLHVAGAFEEAKFT
jgi:hypothetical protein